ncbi:HNH endonuclease [Pyramidobacter sp. C12-8]|uniref:HNH endonuclease n=1 Tax=Pyramidobacter sp. C12-8 TaxID=1943580 RepID=UPI00098EF2B0|nr:HNH endonuclease [Pyramidobacter sp. C12-8]OON87798.1 hypothetical protein B0D78_09320 [Pyramidobacter sp. C12-8]
MPRRAKHPCPHPGCGALVEAGHKYCPLHESEHPIRRSEYDKKYDAKRPESHRFYHTARWQRLRNAYIRKHPLCEECMRNGRIAVAKVVDHIVEIKDGGPTTQWSNLQSLCMACHNAKTLKEKENRERKRHSGEGWSQSLAE